LSWLAMGSALFHALISCVVLVVAQLVVNLSVPWTAVFFPLVVLPLILATMGVAWFLAATGVFVRDISQITGVVTMVLMFLSPVFYPVDALPEGYRQLFLLNPLTFIIEQARDVLVWGRMPDWSGIFAYFVVATLVAWCGFWWFQKTRKGFADVL